jgi:hypothetical protein
MLFDIDRTLTRAAATNRLVYGTNTPVVAASISRIIAEDTLNSYTVPIA